MNNAVMIVVGALAVACGRAEPGEAKASATTSASTASTAMPRIDAPDGDFKGRVEDRLAAGSYTYMLVRTAQGRDEWVVTFGGGAPVGVDVNVTNMGVRSGFHSKRLGRTVDRLVFAIGRRVDVGVKPHHQVDTAHIEDAHGELTGHTR